MLFLRAALLEFLVCFHVIGGAVLFRRWFPRESPWLGFFLPVLAVMFVFNFIEHSVALPSLGWLLPISLAGLLFAMVRPGYSWEGLRLPSVLFVVAFTYALVIRGKHPEIPCWTEAMSDLGRMLDFCLGEKVPPTDCWLPPYDHGGYYTFQHYGGSLLKRLFSLDIGTAYNVSFVFLDAIMCLSAAAVAFSLSGKPWVAAAVMLAVMASFTGGAVLMLFNKDGPDFMLAFDLHHGWCDQTHNPLWKLLATDPYQQRTRMFAPGDLIYLPEFHANLSGYFMTLASIFAGVEMLKVQRSNGPWIFMVVLSSAVIITSTWFLPVVLFFCATGIAVALAASRRPLSWPFVSLVSALAVALIWPSITRLIGSADPLPFRLTGKEEHTFIWMFAEQWWPVYVPWLAICFVWPRLDLAGRWLHAAIPALLILFEVFTIGERTLTIEKIWSGIYAAGFVTFLALLYGQRGWPLRVLTIFMLIVTLMILRARWIETNRGVDWDRVAFRLQGDMILYNSPIGLRLEKAMERVRGVTILSGRTQWGYNPSPIVAELSENRCYVGWTFHEELAGNGQEPYYRVEQSNDFYAGKMDDPLTFLNDHQISAVLIWPDDLISDEVLNHLTAQLGTAFYYVDCKEPNWHNAGIFFRSTPLKSGLEKTIR